MDYASIASKIIEQVGGKDNIRSVQHCATRLRFHSSFERKRQKAFIYRLSGVFSV